MPLQRLSGRQKRPLKTTGAACTCWPLLHEWERVCAGRTPRTPALQGAELGHAPAQYLYAKLAYGERDWERFVWLGRAAARGAGDSFFPNAVEFVPLFERGECGRVLHSVGPLIAAHLDLANHSLFERNVGESATLVYLRVVQLYEAMLERARRALVCWGVVGRRLGVAKDVRVVIAKMAWEEVWLWDIAVLSQLTSEVVREPGKEVEMSPRKCMIQ
jgi:hypothetical protein